jgi:hypothetical protein
VQWLKTRRLGTREVILPRITLEAGSAMKNIKMRSPVGATLINRWSFIEKEPWVHRSQYLSCRFGLLDLSYLLTVVFFYVEAVNVFRLEIVLEHKSLAIKYSLIKLLGDGANSVDEKEA